MNSNIIFLCLGFIFCISNIVKAQWVKTNIQHSNTLSIVATNTALPTAVLAGSDCDGGIYKTYDGGNSWVPDSSGLGHPANRSGLFFLISDYDELTILPFIRILFEHESSCS